MLPVLNVEIVLVYSIQILVCFSIDRYPFIVIFQDLILRKKWLFYFPLHLKADFYTTSMTVSSVSVDIS